MGKRQIKNLFIIILRHKNGQNKFFLLEIPDKCGMRKSTIENTLSLVHLNIIIVLAAGRKNVLKICTFSRKAMHLIDGEESCHHMVSRLWKYSQNNAV